MSEKILIVDDEPILLKGLKFSLEQDGYNVETAVDGNEAFEKIMNNSYELVVLDLMLPEIDGLEVCKKVRESSMVPIIILTAKGDDSSKVLGLEYGADDYLTKPFNILELKARIKVYYVVFKSMRSKRQQVLSMWVTSLSTLWVVRSL